MDREKIIKNLPFVITKQLINYKGYIENKNRFSGGFSKFLETFEKEDNQVPKTIDLIEVKNIIRNIPFYKKYQNITSFDELPIVNKEIMIANFDSFLSTFGRKKFQNFNTSGSTGTAFRFPVSKEFIHKKFASIWYFRNLHGLYKSKKNANIIGRVFLPTNKKNPPYWVNIRATNQLILSQYHLSEKTIQDYLQEIINQKVKWLHGYPSTLTFFAELSQYHPKLLNRLNLEAITCSSETLFDQQKVFIEKTFKTKLLNFYGQAEGVADIFQCEKGNLHVNGEYSYVEFIKDENSDYYRIIGTQLSNKIFPFIRYDTGDLAELPEKDFQCSCGRKSQIVSKIIGRSEDSLQLSDGRRIGRLDHIFKNTLGILEAQIHQYEKGTANFWIVKREGFSKEDEKKLKKEIENKLGKNFHYTIQYKKAIPRTKLGKLKAVVSHIKNTK